MPAKIFVDGQEGTTGLRIHEYLAARSDVEVLIIDSDKRKDPAERKRLLNAADVAILCLPDVASREAVALIDNPHTKVIDASTAFRTDPTWAYGLPELSSAQREKIRTSQRVAVPGCHASAFLLAVTPLVEAGMIDKNATLTCCSLTGYTGGGKKMIAAYESPDAPAKLRGPRHYALGLNHKHLPEMCVLSGLTHAPVFTPVVCNIPLGLAAEVFLPAAARPTGASAEAIHSLLTKRYAGEAFVRVLPLDIEQSSDEGFFDITACNNTNRADIAVCGNSEQVTLIARLDNLGKGASGAAVQCLNLLLGTDEHSGLDT